MEPVLWGVLAAALLGLGIVGWVFVRDWLRGPDDE